MYYLLQVVDSNVLRHGVKVQPVDFLKEAIYLVVLEFDDLETLLDGAILMEVRFRSKPGRLRLIIMV